MDDVEGEAGRPEQRRPRRVEVRPFPSSRRLVTAAVRSGRRRLVPMHGLLEVDVTEARRELARHDPPLSFTAFVVASVARAAAAHPEVHAYRDWRGRLVLHRHVDVTTLVEVPGPQGSFGLATCVSDADVRGVEDISDQLRTVKSHHRRTASGRALDHLAPFAARVPGLPGAFMAVLARSVRARQHTGTITVTAVGMFGEGAAFFGIAPPTVTSLTLVIGGISREPRVADGDRIEARDILHLTVTVDHNVVDGAPATRFGAGLRRILESAEVLRPAEAPYGAGARAVR